MNRLLTALCDVAEADSRKSAILEVQKYLKNQWRGIRARRKDDHLLVGCCAEGHGSHVLSARLRSRPPGGANLGANQMAHLRAHRENGVNLSRIHIE